MRPTSPQSPPGMSGSVEDHDPVRPDDAPPEIDEDARAMAQVAAGRTGAFDAVVLRHRDGLYRFFLRMGWSPPDAEDLVQDVFLRIYARAGEYVPTARFTTFLYRVARNQAIDRARRQKRRGAVESLDRPLPGREGDEADASLGDAIAAPADPASALERAETEAWRRKLLARAVRTLPGHERAVFALSGREGLNYAGIAEALGIPVGTVKSRMHSAVHRLRDYLRRRGLHG